MSNMNFNSPVERYKRVVIDGEYFYHDIEEDMYIPIPSQQSQASYDQGEAQYIPSESEAVSPSKEKKRKYSLSSKLWLGGLAAGVVILPPAAHVAAEQIASQTVNFIDPRPDRSITQDDLLQDISVSINKMIGGHNG